MKQIFTLGSFLLLSFFSMSQPVMVNDFSPGQGYTKYTTFSVIDNYLYFSVDTSNNNLHVKDVLLRSNGTATGIEFLGFYEFVYGACFKAGSNVFFGAHNNDTGGLYKTNGSLAGTQMIKPISVLNLGTNYSLDFKGKLIFAANDVSNNSGEELWESDGTFTGTKLLANLEPLGNYGSSPRGLAANGDYFICSGNNWPNSANLYGSDGTTAGTVKLPFGPANIYTKSQAYNGSLYFLLNDYNNMQSIYKLGKTTNSFRSNNALGMSGFGIIGDKLLHSAFTVPTGHALFVMDTALQNETFLKNVLRPSNFTNVGNFLYFVGLNPLGGSELWKSDGTAAGTTLVSAMWSGIYSTMPSELTVVNGKLYFSAGDSLHGKELYELNPANDSITLYDIYVGTESGFIGMAGVMQGQLFFYAINGTHGGELWKIGTSTAGNTDVAKESAYLQVYPNPANSELHIACSEKVLWIEIYDLNGKLKHASDALHLDISSYPAGMYFVTVETSKGLSSQKFIKQ